VSYMKPGGPRPSGWGVTMTPCKYEWLGLPKVWPIDLDYGADRFSWVSTFWADGGRRPPTAEQRASVMRQLAAYKARQSEGES